MAQFIHIHPTDGSDEQKAEAEAYESFYYNLLAQAADRVKEKVKDFEGYQESGTQAAQYRDLLIDLAIGEGIKIGLSPRLKLPICEHVDPNGYFLPEDAILPAGLKITKVEPKEEIDNE